MSIKTLNKTSLNGEGKRELENLQNEIRYLEMRIQFAKEDIKFFTTGIEITNKKLGNIK